MLRANEDRLTAELFYTEPGPSNPLIALTYSSVAVARHSQTNLLSGITLHDAIPFGWYRVTEHENVPATGTATYNGILFGVAMREGSRRVLDLTGTVRIDQEFGRGPTGTVTLRGTDDRTGEIFELGSFPIVNDLPSSSTSLFAGIGPSSERVRAHFAGPRAEEMVGAFVFHADIPGMGPETRVTASFAAKR